jgi:hypothetical protein
MMSTTTDLQPSPSSQTCNSKNNQSAFEHTNEFFLQHIEHAHDTGIWTWIHAHNTRWRTLFYNYLLRESRTSPPLTADETRAYNAQLAKELPSEGFFPAPHIAIRSIALTRTLLEVHEPLHFSPIRLQVLPLCSRILSSVGPST